MQCRSYGTLHNPGGHTLTCDPFGGYPFCLLEYSPRQDGTPDLAAMEGAQLKSYSLHSFLKRIKNLNLKRDFIREK